MTKKVAEKKQFYKVISPGGHNGFVYKLGLNIDPNARPLNMVGSCQPGALYFTDKENLSSFRGYGTIIGWITPKSPVKLDSKGDKWKAHQVEVTKMLSVEDALPLIYTDIEELMGAYRNFRLKIPKKVVDKFPLINRWMIYAIECDYDSSRRNFLNKHSGDKKFVQDVYDLYKKSHDWRFSDTVVAFWLYKNGVELEKLCADDLIELFNNNTAFKALLKKNVGKKTYNLIKLFVG